MCNLSQGIYDRGYDKGRIQQAIDIYREEMHLSDYEIMLKLQEKFQMTKEQAEEYIMQPV